MPRLSKRAILIGELGDAVASHHIFCNAHKLMCEDSESNTNDDELVGSKELAVIHYAAVYSTCYLYRANSYWPDVGEGRSGNIMPGGKKIVLGYKYNNEEKL